MICPNCNSLIEDYSEAEGGWCPTCEIWFPSDILLDALEEEFGEDIEYDDEWDSHWKNA